MKHKSILTIHKNVNRNKYNKIERTNFPPSPEKNYIIRKDGWRKKRDAK